jgi:hypothetical protein
VLYTYTKRTVEKFYTNSTRLHPIYLADEQRIQFNKYGLRLIGFYSELNVVELAQHKVRFHRVVFDGLSLVALCSDSKTPTYILAVARF